MGCMIYKTGMRIFTIVTALIFSALIIGCDMRNDGEIEDLSSNTIGILSPDGSQIVFMRHFDYDRVYPTPNFLAGVGNGSGKSCDNFYDKTFIYTINRETKKLRRLGEIKDAEKDRWSQNISWEGNLIAYGFGSGSLNNYVHKIYVMNYDGSNNHIVVSYEPSYLVSSIPLTLSGDCQKLFYINRGEQLHLQFESSLYSINLDGTGKSLVSDLHCPDWNLYQSSIDDIMWDSRRGCIIIINCYECSPFPYDYWQINPDGTNLRAMEPEYLAEYKRRKIYGSAVHGLLESELEKMTRNITYAEWGVPSPYSQ